MGMGHVPSGEVPRAREGADIPRRQRGRAGEGGDLSLEPRPDIGAAGESIAAHFLSDHDVAVVARNVSVPGGEIDLLAVDGTTRVAVEVRTITGRGDPIDAIDDDKRRHVTRIASRVGAHRVDFIGVRLSDTSCDVHWLPG